jgi:hypothetical protein
MDYVIDGKFRMQEHAILTKSTPIALKSTANHIKYENCSVTGAHNKLSINYPSFSHTVTSKN